MPKFKRVRPVRVSDGAFEQIKQSILLGQFKPCHRLPFERELADTFQVSRVAIREAIRALENSGFLLTVSELSRLRHSDGSQNPVGVWMPDQGLPWIPDRGPGQA